VPVEFALGDMRRFSRPATFALIINFFTSFGYFDDQADDLRVLKLVRENLKPGGVFVLEMVSKERLARAFQATTSRELPNGHVLFEPRFASATACRPGPQQRSSTVPPPTPASRRIFSTCSSAIAKADSGNVNG
jgi:SAM-dependent methyltransferase